MSDVIIFIGVCIVTVLITFAISHSSCSLSAKQNELNYKWGIFAGCSYQHPNGFWVPKENYRVIGD